MAEKRASSGESPAAKRVHLDIPAGSEDAMEAFINVQSELKKIDDACVEEQMKIQSQYDAKKRPLFEQRQTEAEKIPNFWGQALWRHPSLSLMLTEEDKEILKHLKKLDVEDNIDIYGSYRIKMVFDEAAKEYFEPLELVKHVKFTKTDADGDRTVQECTTIKFKPGKDVVEKAKAASDGNGPERSFFEWFGKDDVPEEMDVGEVIRRFVWHQPHLSYMGECVLDDDDDDDDDDADLDDDDADGDDDADDKE
eukprot:Selendium_serpulae@DN4119_c0_g1_i1.p1